MYNTGEHIFFAWEVRPVLRYIEVTEFKYGIHFFLARHVFFQFSNKVKFSDTCNNCSS